MQTTSNTFRVQLSGKSRIAEGIMALQLRALPGCQLPAFEAGAHLDLHLADGLVRQYSLSNDPGQPDHYRLAVLLEASSRGGSAAVHHALRVGDELTVSQPRNLFPLDENADHTALFAGGIGITPMLSMAYRLHRLGASFELHYCMRHAQSGAFLAELRESPFAHRVQLHIDSEGGDRRRQFENLKNRNGANTHAYVCGPKGYIEFVTCELARSGWPDHRVHVEHFQSVPMEGGQAFSVLARRSNKLIKVAADCSIADALRAAGIAVDLSCGQGICGTCLVPVVAGIPEHRDLYQTTEEQQAHTQIAVCCSRAASETLVLDI